MPARSRRQSRYRLGVDVGGTHTDLVLLDTATGELAVEKVSSTPRNPALGVLEGVARFVKKGVPPGAIEFFAHGTTITTNALLEMRGATVGLLITKGYRAVQEVQNQVRDGNVFEYFYEKPIPIAPQSMTREIPGRIDFEGNELEPLGEEAVRQAATELKAKGATSIAVCFLFSYANPSHEERTRDILRHEFPEAQVSLSSEVLPRIREWARLSTTLLNAYLEPVLVNYIAHLDRGIVAAGIDTQQRFLMQSNGGVMPFKAAASGGKTVHTLFSGPAAGAQASAWLAAADAKRGLITLDMGGTSCDIAFIEGGQPLEVTEVTVARRPLGVPALDLTSISAGGGSIAWIDPGGFLAVGPRSAGRRSGPRVLWARRRQPDRDRRRPRAGLPQSRLFSGRRTASRCFGGRRRDRPKDREAARHERRGRRGRHPPHRRYAHGRRGPRLRRARAASMRRISPCCPSAAPARSMPPRSRPSWACGASSCRRGRARSRRWGSSAPTWCMTISAPSCGPSTRSRPITPRVFSPRSRRAPPRSSPRKGWRDAAPRNERSFDMRYTGQGYELTISLAGIGRSGFTAAALKQARARFDEVHARIHGHAARERPVEIVSYRLRVRVAAPKYKPRAAKTARARAAPKGAAKGTRRVRFDAAREVRATLYERGLLPPGARLDGPAIVEQFDATTVVPPGWGATVDDVSNLILTRRKNG